MEPDRLASGESGDILVWTCVDLLTGDTAKSLQLGTGGVQGHRGTGAPGHRGTGAPGHLTGLAAVGKPPRAVRRSGRRCCMPVRSLADGQRGLD